MFKNRCRDESHTDVPRLRDCGVTWSSASQGGRRQTLAPARLSRHLSLNRLAKWRTTLVAPLRGEFLRRDRQAFAKRKCKLLLGVGDDFVVG